MPVQQLSRTTIGTPITSLEMRIAFEEGYLIPFRKNLPEDPKTADQLINVDKGGLSFRPLTGVYENVAEFDFFSMYPSIIASYNLSYETINCKHPECTTKLPTNYRVCTKKEGIVPKALKFLLNRRIYYKKALKQVQPEKKAILDRRQKGLKWLLVVSFGYLGYKNAVFGRIESHETTTAIGRQLLLFVKEIVEAKGFRLIHALTDAVWIYRKGATEKDYRLLEKYLNKRLREKFEGVNKNHLDFKILLEGVFDWIVFLPSKQDGIGVPNRFYGKFRNGEIKVRGLEIRRKDTPEFIKMFQTEILERLKKAKNKKEFLEKISETEEILKKYQEKLKNGEFNIFQLIVKKKVSKEVNQYRTKTDISDSAGTLLKEGIKVNPGERINILYVKNELIKGMPLEIYINFPQPLDLEKYLKMLEDSYWSFIWHKNSDKFQIFEG
ncbi:DNA polymerase domain-containing protein [Persephonella sp.]